VRLAPAAVSGVPDASVSPASLQAHVDTLGPRESKRGRAALSWEVISKLQRRVSF
jgi:hypothetical protein